MKSRFGRIAFVLAFGVAGIAVLAAIQWHRSKIRERDRRRALLENEP